MEKIEATPATVSWSRLPDDVLLKILVLVADDEAALFRCATTCQRWRRLVADRTFLRRCWPENASSLVGFFTVQSREDYDYSTSKFTHTPVPTFVPANRSPIYSPVTRILGSFVPTADALLEHATPLASRAGLILLRTVDPSYNTVRLSVCNPLAGTSTGTCDSLPPLERFRVLYSALLTAADFRSKGFYKVIAIGFSGGDIEKYTVLTFSPGDPSWRMLGSCSVNPSGRKIQGLQGQGAAVVTPHGTAHWLLRDASNFCSLNMSVKTGQYSLKKMSISSSQLPLGIYKYDAPRLSITFEGTLLFVCMHREDYEVLTWTRQTGHDGERTDDDTEEWIPTRRFKLTKPEYAYGLRCLCMGARGSTMFMTDYIDDRLYTANLETAQLEQITDDNDDLRYRTVEPFEVDWPTFFMSRIGVQ